VMMFAFFVILVNLVMDVVYVFVDPRIRMKS
jgi:ABC-type dipeptide/oligopeptide/nickel transport system permease component